MKKIGRLDLNSQQRLIIYDTDFESPTLQAAMGAGGGNIPLIIDMENIIIGGEQKHQSIKTDGVCTCLTSSMGTGGLYTNDCRR